MFGEEGVGGGDQGDVVMPPGPGTSRLKRHRAVATRYGRLEVCYEATVLVAAINEWI